MRREGRLHGYEFERGKEREKRVKASRQPTNRSKFRPKCQQEEKAGRPRYKALSKIKGQRNKAHGSDVASNYKMHNWALHTTHATWLADSLEEPADLDPTHQAPLCESLRVLLLSKIDIQTLATEDKSDKEAENGADDADQSNDSDWLDVGSTNGSNLDDDDWYLC